MKNAYLYSLLFFLFTISVFSQSTKIFMVELSNREMAPTFEKDGDLYVYNGSDTDLSEFFQEYEILDFFQSFPDSQRNRTLNVFTFVVNKEDFASELTQMFPSLFISYLDISDFKAELTSTYPNDYGTTSPVTNLGVPYGLSNFDYINVPKAWDYGFGDNAVRIGISDANIDTTDADFMYKTTFLAGYYSWGSYSPPYSMANESWHGTSTAAIAAAQGNNAHGMAGICSNCSIVATHYGYGAPGTYSNPTPNFNNLLQLALNGARVINMSWRSYLSYNANSSNNYYQWIIDEIHDMGVVMVGAAGNENATTTPTSDYPYPASYNHVISVSSVNHLNKLYAVHGPDGTIPSTSPFYNVPLSYYVMDMIAPRVAPNFNSSGLIVPVTDDPNKLHNTNDRVDICAPGFQIFQYPWHVLNYQSGGKPRVLGDGTSSAAPHVTGTVGLMFSLNECLTPDQVEDILQLTATNLESVQGNEYFIGRIGAGKLETGDAVEFVHEAMSATGNAVIAGNDFWRFNFVLENINNNLTISNQTFRDSNTSDFTARNGIVLLPNTHLKPNNEGHVSLRINSAIDVTCNMQRISVNDGNMLDVKSLSVNSTALYPNPNEGIFSISFSDVYSDGVIEGEMSDLNGRVVYKANFDYKKGQNDRMMFDVSNLSQGVYVLKLKSNNNSENLKFIKR